MSTHPITVTVDGQVREMEVDARLLLVHALREHLAVTSPHVGCDTSQCGACTVRLDGRAVKSCTVLAVQADGRQVDTVTGPAPGGRSRDEIVDRLRVAFTTHHAVQCGFCTPAMLLSAAELIEHDPAPTEQRIRSWLTANFCRCTGYQNIVDAVLAAVGAAGATR